MLLLTAFSVFLNSTVVGFEKFYLSQYRLWEFFLGTIVMLIGSKLDIKKLDILSFGLLFFSFTTLMKIIYYNLNPKLLVNLLTCLVLLNSNPNNIFSKINNIKIIEKIGIASYSIYLIHQPVFTNKNFNLKQEIGLSNFYVLIIVVTFSIFFSRYIEFPFLKNLTKFKLYILLFLTTLCIFFAFIGINNSGYQNRYVSYEKIFSIGADRDKLLLVNENGFQCGGLNYRYCGSNDKDTLVLVADSIGEF